MYEFAIVLKIAPEDNKWHKATQSRISRYIPAELDCK